MNRVVPVSGGGTGIAPATAAHFAQRNAQADIIGQCANLLERAIEAIGGVFPDARPAVAGCRPRRAGSGGTRSGYAGRAVRDPR
jgi:NAD(P)-dependent dehydrogenase (short-subunit alcohol dehydrogenase family)